MIFALVPRIFCHIFDGSSKCSYAHAYAYMRRLARALHALHFFLIRSGKSGKSFVQELARFFHAYADKSALEAIALEAAMVMPALILQKSHPNSKVKEHTAQLERRLKAWKDGNLEELLQEGRTIQSKFSRSHQPRGKLSEQLARSFANLMMEG